MNGLPDSINPICQTSLKVRLLMALSIWLIPFALVKADNKVYVDIAKTGTTTPVDTMYSGGSYEFRIWIENDTRLRSLIVSLRNWVNMIPAPDGETGRGVYFTWEDVDGYGPTGLNTGHACVTVVPGCRMDPPGTVWDYGTGFRVWEHNLNEVSPDSIGFGGNSFNNGLPAGPLQHMVSVHFKATALNLSTVYMHLDSAFISVGGGMVFFDVDGNRITPKFTTDQPWKIRAVCGDANSDSQVNVADAVYLIKYVFRGGPAPKPLIASNVNGDEEVNVADIVYLINYVFKSGPAPDC